jgi:hypothetical protein
MVFDDITIIIRMQNIQLLKYIAWKEGWNYLELCKRYIK